MQNEIPLLCAVKTEFLDNEVIKNLNDEKDAIIACIEFRKVRYTLGEIAARLGIDKGHFSRIMSRQAHFPEHKRIELMNLCGNYAPIQFEVMKTNFINKYLSASLKNVA